MPQSWNFQEISNFPAICLATYQHSREVEPQTWAQLTDNGGMHMEETLWNSRWTSHFCQRVQTQGKLWESRLHQLTAAKSSGGIICIPHLPVIAPPRLPLLSCLPSSLSCLLNLEDLPGLEDTSGLLDFRKGIGGGDNIWSSCKETEEKIHIYVTFKCLPSLERDLSYLYQKTMTGFVRAFTKIKIS